MEDIHQKNIADHERQNAEKLAQAERQNSMRLAEARRPNDEKLAQAEEQNRKMISPSQMKNAQDLAKNASVSGAISLLKQFQITDIFFVFPLMLAMIKDVLDLFLIGSIPAIGTALSICASIAGGLFIYILGAGEASKKARGFFSGAMKRYLTLIGGTIIEFVFGVNFLPVETATMIIIYLMLLSERKQNEQPD